MMNTKSENKNQWLTQVSNFTELKSTVGHFIIIESF